MNVLISRPQSDAGLAGAWKDLLTVFDGAASGRKKSQLADLETRVVRVDSIISRSAQ